MTSGKVQKTIDSKKVEYKEGIGINILPREDQTTQNALRRILMISKLGADGEYFRILSEGETLNVTSNM